MNDASAEEDRLGRKGVDNRVRVGRMYKGTEDRI